MNKMIQDKLRYYPTNINYAIYCKECSEVKATRKNKSKVIKSIENSESQYVCQDCDGELEVYNCKNI